MMGMPSGMPDIKSSSSAEANATFSGTVRTGNVPFDLTTGGGMRGGFVNNAAFPGATVVGAGNGGDSAGMAVTNKLKPFIYAVAAGLAFLIIWKLVKKG
jgi:hypothetical protein